MGLIAEGITEAGHRSDAGLEDIELATQRRRPPGPTACERPRADSLSRRRQVRTAPATRPAPPIRSRATIRPMATNVFPTSKPRCVYAGCATAWSFLASSSARRRSRSPSTALQTAARMGVKDLMWFPSASFPSQEPVIDLMEAGVVHHIEGSMNGPLGDYCSHGKMRGYGVLRSHGGRWQAIQDGEVHIDIAVIAAPTADAFGNARRFASASRHAARSALRSRIPSTPITSSWSRTISFRSHAFRGRSRATTSTTSSKCRRSAIPRRSSPAQRRSRAVPTACKSPSTLPRFLRDAGIMRDGFSFQAGAGGIALAFVDYLRSMMKDAGVKASFVRGGSTKYLVEMLQEGLTGLHPRRADFRSRCGALHADRSAPRRDRRRSPRTTITAKGNFASMIDAVVLGATEVDVNFNGNVVTHSDGRLLHGIGGWQNCLVRRMHHSRCPLVPRSHSRDRGRSDHAHRSRRIDRRHSH